MRTGRRTSPASWLWRVVTLAVPRAARVTGFVPRGRSAQPPAPELSLPSGWRVVQAAPPAAPGAGTLSRSTRSIVGALTWYEQPLTLAR